MTLCIGIERRGKIWIGADCASIAEDWHERAREPKVWRTGKWIIAGAGHWRALSVARLGARLPDPKTEASLVFGVVGELQRVLESSGVTLDEESRPSWLIGAQGLGLWRIDDEWHVSRVGEAAIGMAFYAYGWLDGSPITEPELRIRECIKAAAKRFPSAVSVPATVLSTCQ